MTKIRLTSVNALVAMAERGRVGRDWYAHAHAQLLKASDLLGMNPERVASVLAITSPRVSVKRNIRFALRYLATGEYPHDMMRGIKAGLEHYEKTGEIRGPKTAPFARAIQGDGSAIVLDVWMAVAFGIDQKLFARKPVRIECQRRIKRAAKRLGWSNAETQAAIWYATVKRAGRKAGRFDLVIDTLFGGVLVNPA